MILDKLSRLFARRGPSGLCIQLGTSICRLKKSGLSIRGSGPYMKISGNGHRWEKMGGKAILIPSKEPNPHILISGMSGFGKSMFFKSVLVDIADANLSCIIFDGHNEHAAVVSGLGGQVYDSKNGGINLLSLDGATVSDRIASLTALIGNVYRLGHIQSTKLGQCLKYTYRKFGARGGNDTELAAEPRVSDLMSEIGIFIQNAKTASEKATLLSLQNKVCNLDIPAFNKKITENDSLKNGIHSFSISERMSKEARMIYLIELLDRIYAGMKDDPKNQGVKQYLMIDESQILINESESCSGIITNFIEEGRKYGRGVIIVAHMASWLNKQIVANAATFMAFYSREPSEASYVAKVMSSSFEAEQAVRSKLATLGDGEAIIITANRRTPTVVSTRPLHSRASLFKEIKRRNLEDLVRKPILLEDLCQKAEMREDQIRALIGTELGRFNLNGKEWLMRKASPGVEHQVMVAEINSKVQKSGIRSYIHNAPSGPDVVVYGASGKIAIEYETGSKSMAESMEMFRRRLKTFKKLVVVVNDAHFSRYKAETGSLSCVLLPASEIAKLPSICKNQAYERLPVEAAAV